MSWPFDVTLVMKRRLREKGIQHREVTSIWPQANGEVERQNRSLLKRLKIAQAEGKDWRKEINTYLLMYRSTAHSTTGVSPAELLFKRKIRTKLPEFYLSCFHDLQFARDHDAKFKQKGKVYADLRQSAGHSDVKPGDTVSLKQNRDREIFKSSFTSFLWISVIKNFLLYSRFWRVSIFIPQWFGHNVTTAAFNLLKFDCRATLFSGTDRVVLRSTMMLSLHFVLVCRLFLVLLWMGIGIIINRWGGGMRCTIINLDAEQNTLKDNYLAVVQA
ncbi:uncharacterized protein LOC143471376 [Clavelina lepadiformis]|uniref:uncharacterized protein LOC143471376 n=1 Tax=Clavelina lepadiformis TaxID=159417 RepID=UPI004040FF97